MFCTVDFVNRAGQPINPDNKTIVAWYERMKARPSAEASGHQRANLANSWAFRSDHSWACPRGWRWGGKG